MPSFAFDAAAAGAAATDFAFGAAAAGAAPDAAFDEAPPDLATPGVAPACGRVAATTTKPATATAADAAVKECRMKCRALSEKPVRNHVAG